MHKPLILGARGNLGTQLVQVFPECVPWDKEDCDVTNFSALTEKVSAVAERIDCVINCVAFNDVDGAETNPSVARLLNADVTAVLAHVVNQLDVPLVHLSTGYVFSGKKDFYVETDRPDPVSIYAQTKAAGERAVIATAKKYYIVRTNLLFGPAGTAVGVKPSVVDTMLTRGKETHFLKGITDTNCGFKCYEKKAAKDIFSHQLLNGWGFDVELLYIAQKRNYNIKEIPVVWAHGRDSKVDLKIVPILTLIELLMIKINDWKGRYER